MSSRIFCYLWCMACTFSVKLHGRSTCSDMHPLLIDPTHVFQGLQDFVTRFAPEKCRSGVVVVVLLHVSSTLLREYRRRSTLHECSDVCVCSYVCACSSLEVTIHRGFEMGQRAQTSFQHTYSSVLCMLDHIIKFRLLPANLSGKNPVVGYKNLKQ